MKVLDKIKSFFKSKLGIILLSVLILIILIIVIIISLDINKKIKIKTINEKVYQVNGNIVNEFDTDIKIDSQRNTIVGLYKNEKKVSLSSNPVYYNNANKVIFPKSMIAVFPYKHMQQYKINYFTTATLQSNSVYLTGYNLTYLLTNAFLFDGDNLYFFTEETKITFDNKEYILSPLSYVVMRYDSSIQIYNYKTKINIVEDVISNEVYAHCNNYKINLGIDSVTANGEERLLIGNVNSLDNLK